jgi:lipoprotein NlpI
MQQTVPSKKRRLVATLFLSLLVIPAWSQAPAPAPAPGGGSDAKSYTQFGMANGAKGDLDAAITAFNEAIKIDPGYAPAYYFRAFAHSQQQKADEAISDYDHTIQLDPKYKDAYYQRGCLKGQKGDFNGALSDFNKVIALDPKYVPAYYNSGHVYYFQGQLDKALDSITQALTLDPNYPLSYFIRGLIKHGQLHRDEAMSDFQKSAGFSFPYASFWIWIIDNENQQPGVARKDLTDAVAKSQIFKPNDWHTQIANFLLGKMTHDELLAKAQQGEPTEFQGRVCEAWFYAGMSKRFAGDIKGAMDCFAKAIATGSKGSEEYVEAQRALADAQNR